MAPSVWRVDGCQSRAALLDPFILAPIESERVALQATPQVSGASQVDGFVWIHDQWLADILLWRIYSVGGFGMLCLLMALVCVGASVWVMATALKPVTKSAAITLLTLFLCAMPCSIQWFVQTRSPFLSRFLLCKSLLSEVVECRRHPITSTLVFASTLSLLGQSAPWVCARTFYPWNLSVLRFANSQTFIG